MDEYQTEESKLVHEFQKNSQEVVRAYLKTYRGTRLIDIRVYFDAGMEHKPTRKGLAVSAALLPEHERTIEKLREAMMAH